MPDFNPYQAQLTEIDERLAENQALLTDPELAELAQQEILRLQADKKMLEDAVTAYFSQTSEGESASDEIVNCMIELRGGAGGEEAKIWANDLQRMYLRFLDGRSLKVEMIDESIFKIKGRLTLSDRSWTAYELFRYESGVHRVQRVPATEAQGRIHTSTASVAVIPEVKKTAVEIKDSELEWQFMRAGGAGGQNVNKVNSAVRLTHIPTGISVSSRQERSQAQNREIALELLRGQLWEVQEENRVKAIGEARSAIGRSMRAEKIRTYNYPQNRVTDHRINVSWYSLETIIEGDLEKMLLDTQAAFAQGEADTTASTDSPSEE